MILHFSQMGFTEGLTFTGMTSSVMRPQWTALLYLLRQVIRPRVRS